MLGVASPTITKGENQRRQSMVDSINPVQDEDFHDFTDANLLESINFDDLFMDELPDLEMDPEILTEFSGCGGGSREQSEIVNPSVSDEKVEENPRGREEDKDSGSGGSGLESSLSVSKGEEIASKRDEDVDVKPKGGEGSKGKKSSCTQEKNNNNKHGKRKVKVDWTPELHRRFVQAVEQLGVDKAVPSRILEIMGIDGLTRHNIASHLQKYRSHRKHLLAREAEAANWSQRRQMYGAAAGGTKQDPWHAPTMGFPPITPMHPHHFRPLHVWGHPSMEQSLLQNHIWSNHPPPPHAWGISPPDSSYWHHHRPVPNGLSTPGAPCFPPAMPTARFAAPPMLGILPHPHPMHKVVGEKFDPHPSKESIDEAIGDVLTKPWLPLPLGLKPPSIDSVTVELQRQGIARIPPPTSCN